MDDLTTAGDDELGDRRQVARARGLGAWQRWVTVSALRLRAYHHGTPCHAAAQRGAHVLSVRHHSHHPPSSGCAGDCSASPACFRHAVSTPGEHHRADCTSSTRCPAAPLKVCLRVASRQAPLVASLTSSCVVLSTGCAAPTVFTDPAHSLLQLTPPAFRFPILWPHPTHAAASSEASRPSPDAALSTVWCRQLWFHQPKGRHNECRAAHGLFGSARGATHFLA